jgi:hypothetical protein
VIRGLKEFKDQTVENYRDPFTALSDMECELIKLVDDAKGNTPEFRQFLHQAQVAVHTSLQCICDLAIKESELALAEDGE